MSGKQLWRVLALVTLLMFIIACGDGESADPTATSAPVAEPTDPPVEEPTEEMEEEEDMSSAFPITIEHKYGSTEIPAQPLRVISVGYSEQDELLALGVVPVGLRYWYGPYENGVWPWAQDQLGDAEVEIIATDVINFEAIAELNPDLIVGITSGMTQEEYDSLSAIAPTLAQSADYVDYGVPWQEVMRVLGQATGTSDQAEAIVTDLEDRFADIRATHPEFDGATMAVAFAFGGSPGVYASQDPRPRLMSELGFVTPELYDEVAGDAFYLTFSEEELPEFLDVDTVVWLAGSDEGIQQIQDNALRPSLRVAQEGRELFFGELLGGAFSFSSPLSLNFLLDEMVPMLEAAIDGDPATVVPGASGAMPEPDVADDSAETRLFTDAMDREVAIPVDPQRIVVLSEIDLDSLLALGITPVGAPNGRGQSDLPSYLTDEIAGQTTALGALGEPNLELVAELNPDLIVYSDPYGALMEMIPEMEQIAPVVVPYVYTDSWDWKVVFAAIAESLDMTAEADAVLAEYNAKAESIGAQLPDDLRPVSIVRWMADGPRILLTNAFSSLVLTDIGFERPEYQLDLAGAHPVHTDVINMEQIQVVDAPIVFAGGLNPEGDAVLQDALENPLVQTFESVQNDRFFVVDGLAWSSTGGPLAAMEVLADVEAALVGSSANCEDGLRQVSHALLDAPICVPADPQNVVAIDLAAFEMMLMLGIKPAARPNDGFLQAIYGSGTELSTQIGGLVSDFPDFGSLFDPNLEVLTAAQPDLIIAYQTLPNLDQLAEIAPLITSPYPAQPEGWSEVSELYAEVLGVRDEWDALVAEYDERIAAFEAARLPEYDGATLVYLQNQGELNYVGPPGLAVWETLGDAGFVPIETLPQSVEEAIADYGGPVFVLSEEQIALADADVIILANGGVTPEQNEASDAIIESYRNNPLWSNLQAIQSGDFYPSSIYWQSNGIVSVHAVIDDLFRYFADADPAELSPNPFLIGR